MNSAPEAKRASEAASGSPAKVLEVVNVGKRFGNLVAVDDISLAVARGELRAIIGPNGAGKTTFFNLISGFFPPSAGRIVFDGRDVTTMPAHRRVAIGMARTFQITEIFPELSVYENLQIGVEVAAGYRLRPWISRAEKSAVRGRIDEILDLVGLAGKTDRLVGELAHGDQRVAEIAMALTLRPRLLLLDEPAAGMGDQETYAVIKLIRDLHRRAEMAIVLIEHDMRVVFGLADRITVLDRGRLLAEGSPQEVAGEVAVQQAYLETLSDTASAYPLRCSGALRAAGRARRAVRAILREFMFVERSQLVLA